MTRSGIEHASAQAGTADDAGTPTLWVLLVALLGAPVAWSLHLLGSYVVVGYACATGWGGARSALVAISIAALVATAASGWLARKRWRIAREIDRPTDDAWDARMGERTARVSFLMVSGLVLAAIFAAGILYEALTIFLAPLCEAGVGA